MKSLRNHGLLLLSLCLLATAVGCGSDPSGDVNKVAPQGTGFLTRTVNTGKETRKYSMFVPFTYEPSKRYPTIIFLHGIGESGDDAHKNLTVGLAPHIAKHPEQFPFIVLFPQSGGDWTGEDRAQMVASVMDDAEQKYSIDRDRIILTGLSTGGYGTWRIGAQYADRFAALVPMAGYGDGDDVPTLAHLPIWIFHNTGDPFVLAMFSSGMYDKLKAAGANVQYTEYGSLGHDCWDRAYDDGKLFDWMLKQRRK